jgi:hypothetical protein
LRNGSETPWDLTYMKIKLAGEEYTFTAEQQIDSRQVDLLTDSDKPAATTSTMTEDKLEAKPPLPKAQVNQPAAAAVSSARKMDLTNYEIQIKTANDFGTGTDDIVRITLMGTSGDLANVQLKDSATNENPFERGQLDRFFFNDLDDVGNVCHYFSSIFEICDHIYFHKICFHSII